MQRPRPRHQRCAAKASPRDALALFGVIAIYWLRIYPQARRELAGWERRARHIPDPAIREQALRKLTDERLNPEGAALFAVLAPRAERRRLISLIVAYQVLYDYLDAINEEADGAQLRNGLHLHRALAEAVLPDRPVSDYYLHHPKRRDGGYMRALTDACRRIVRTLPSVSRCEQVLAHATERCGEAQSHNHAILVSGESQLVAWSLAQGPGRADYLWWELAAGGISCLGIHALLACTADPETTPQDAAEVDAAYFPTICALSTLLDSLADYHRDAGTANHSLIAHYRDSGHAGERLIAITSDAAERIEGLRHGRRHRIIVAAICAYYLSSGSVREGFPAPVAERLMQSVGRLAMPLHATMRVRRFLHAAIRGNGRAVAARDITALLLLKGQARRRTRRDEAGHGQHEERGADDSADGPEHLRGRARKWRRKAGHHSQVAIDQGVAVEARRGTHERAHSQHQS
jgi:tetraprenyl-beta-curcumene synthase